MLKLAYGDATVTIKTVYKCSSFFVMVVHLLRSWRNREFLQHKKIQENVERVSTMIRSNRRLTIREIFENLDIS